MHAAMHRVTSPHRWEYRPMTATPTDIKQLEGVLTWLKSQRDSTTLRVASDALSRAITLLTEDHHTSAVGWVLAALAQAVQRNAGGGLYVADWDLFEWAIGQVQELTRGTSH